MESIKVALLGLGTVGRGVYETIQTHQKQLHSLLGKRVEIVAVLVREIEKKREIELGSSVFLTTDYEEILELPHIDFVIEMMGGIEPAKLYIEQAINKGCNVVTANKELMAFHGKELCQLAEQAEVKLAYEASVAGAIPVIRTLTELLQVNQITKIEAIINGTTNYILTQMRTGKISFQQALFQAQAKGYAEADPANDIEGWDAFFKLMVISDIVFHDQPNWNHVERIGIENVSVNDLAVAEALGLRLKLLASLSKTDEGWEASVKPTFIPSSHPLYSVEGVHNGIVIETDLAGQLFFQGAGAGSFATASAIIEDVVNIWQRRTIVTSEKGVKWKVNLQQKGKTSNWFMIQSKEKFGKSEEFLIKNKFKQLNIQIDAIHTSEDPIVGPLSGYIISGDEQSIKQVKYHMNEFSGIGLFPISGRLDQLLILNQEQASIYA